MAPSLHSRLSLSSLPQELSLVGRVICPSESRESRRVSHGVWVDGPASDWSAGTHCRATGADWLACHHPIICRRTQIIPRGHAPTALTSNGCSIDPGLCRFSQSWPPITMDACAQMIGNHESIWQPDSPISRYWRLE